MKISDLLLLITTILVIKDNWQRRKILMQDTFKKNRVEFMQHLCKIITFGLHWFKQIKPDKEGRIFSCRLCDQIEKERKTITTTTTITIIKKYFPITFWMIILCLIYIAFKCSQWLCR